MICGREDKIVDPREVESAVLGLPNFRLVMLDNCGHAPQLELPRVINPLVAKFLQEHASPPRPAAGKEPRPALAAQA